MNEEVRLLAAGLRVGDTLRTTCPRCGGGKEGEASFSITKEADKVLYCCFRNKCNMKGKLEPNSKSSLYVQEETATSQDVQERERRARAARIWDESTFPNAGQDGMLARRYGMDVMEYIHPRYYAGMDRFLIPCFMGAELRGFVARTYDPCRAPKALSYKLTDKTLLAAYTPFNKLNVPHGCVVVEDCFSAAAVAAQGLRSIALIGTDTTDEGWDDIREFGEGRAVVALDPDASAESVKRVMQRSLRFDALDALVIPADFKDMEREQRRLYCEEVRKAWSRV